MADGFCDCFGASSVLLDFNKLILLIQVFYNSYYIILLTNAKVKRLLLLLNTMATDVVAKGLLEYEARGRKGSARPKQPI